MGEPKLPSAFLQVSSITYRSIFSPFLVVLFITACFSIHFSSLISLCYSCFMTFYVMTSPPPLPPVSYIMQVICWVLGEYGTADGKYSASYITGKLFDVAEAHSTDDTVKVGIHVVTIYNLLCDAILPKPGSPRFPLSCIS